MGVVRKITIPILVAFIAHLLGAFPWLRGPEEEIKPYKISPAQNLSKSSMVYLNGGEKFGEGILIGSESLPILNGILYTGLDTGNIVNIKDGKINNVTLPCGSSPDQPCRRPLGLRFDKSGLLYVADAKTGIYTVDVTNGKINTLVDSATKIDGLPLLFTDDLDIGSDGSVYFSDLSTVGSLHSGIWKEVLGKPTGRLIKYTPKGKSLSVLLKDIHGANGVQLSPQEDFVLVNECVTGRILRYYLKGPKKGQSDVFADGLPGMVDNIRRNGENGIRVFVFGSRGVAEFFNSNQYLRKVAYRLSAAVHQIKIGLPVVFPQVVADALASVIPDIETFTFKPSPVVAIDLDWSGKITKSYHCTDGSVKFVSEMTVLNDNVYLASPFIPYMTRVQKMSTTKK